MTTASFNRAAAAGPISAVFERWQFASLAETAAKAPARAPAPDHTAELARLRAEAEAAGRAEGFLAGQAEGRAAAAAEAGRLRELTASMSYAIRTLQDEVGLAVMGLAFDVARQVLREELSINREAMLAGVREAIDLAGQGPNPQLQLHPDDVEFVAQHLEGEIAAGNWRVNGDARIDPGGCRVSTANGSIDATLALRWRRVAASLGRDDAWEK